MSSYIEFLITGGGIGTPGGSPSDIQFNSAGSFGGLPNFTYTGPSALGAATNNVGVSVLGTLNTSGVIDGAAFFANITNSASGANSLSFDLQVNGASIFNIDMAGDIFLSGNRAISSSTGLTIQQTGDVNGPTSFQLLNRFNNNGAIFSQLGNISTVDFGFNINGTGGFNGEGLIRYERRPTAFAINQNQQYEFEMGDVTALTGSFVFAVGDTVMGFQPLTAQSAVFQLNGGANVTSDIWFTHQSSGFIRAIRMETRTFTFLSTKNTSYEIQIGSVEPSSVWQLAIGDGTIFHAVTPQYSQNTTGAGSAALGANCPATTLTAPYTWIEAFSSDGSLVYIPAFK